MSHGLAASSVGLWFLIYLTDTVHLPPQLAGLAMIIGRVWDAFTDPIMGWISDNTKSRWGKRRPWLLFGALPYAIAYAGMWMIPDFGIEPSGNSSLLDTSTLLTFGWVSLVVVIFNTFLTAVFIPYTSLTAAITNDYNERTSLTSYRMVCSQTAMLIGAAVPSSLLLWIAQPDVSPFLYSLGSMSVFGSWAGSSHASYAIMAVIFALIMVASILTCFWGTRERSFSLSMANSRHPLAYISSILHEIKRNKPFRIAALMILLTNCAATLVASTLPYFVQYVLKLAPLRTSIVSTLFVSAILSIPFWALLSRRIGKTSAYRAGMSCFVIVLCLLPILNADRLPMLFVTSCLAGICYGAGLMLPWAIIPDVVEYDQMHNGSRREGLFYGGTTFCYKMATALALFLSSQMLGILGYVPNIEQSGSVILGIKLLIGPIPALLIVLSIVATGYYTLTETLHKEITAKLNMR